MGIIREKCSDYCSPIVLCKKVNGAMKTSSVSSNSRSPTPSPMESKHSLFAMLRRLFKPWKWKLKKKSDRFEQTSRTLERNLTIHSPLVSMKKKKYRCGQRTVRLAVVESSATGISSKARSLRAQAQLIKTKTLTIEKEQRKTEVREQALPSTHHGNPIVE
ncbi:phosphatase and actin regulator 2 [Trichonephila clavipes]|nr:phosphatase and actin regulator 2 [Trichonephila clavipes]